MDYLEQLLGSDLNVTERTLIAFAVVLVLIVVIAWVFRRLSRGPARAGRRGRVARLAILEAVSIDQKRRLLLMRRDNVEHVILIGGNTDLVIEQGIQRATRQPGARGGERIEPSVRQATAGRPAEPSPGRPARPSAPTPAPRGDMPGGAAYPAGASAPHQGVAEGDGDERQLADMADRLKAALREPLPDAAQGGRRPAPAAEPGPAENLPPTSGDPRKPD